MIKVALNGCGRIGKTFLRIACADAEFRKKIEIVALNIGPADKGVLEYLITYDSILGMYQEPVRLEGDMLTVGNQKMQVYAEADARKLPWNELGIDWVLDVSGRYTKREKAQDHIDAGAKKVLVSAPAKGDDVTIIPGVNMDQFDQAGHKIVSLGSCTTNAAVPILHLLEQAYEIESASLYTVHAYTNTQALLDVNPTAKDVRRSRAAAINMVPTSTGAMEAVFRVLPGYQGKLIGGALRVPVPVVSLVDITFTAAEPINLMQLNDLFMKASNGSLKSIMAFTQEPLVSSDYQGNPHSVTVDGTLSMAVKRTGRVFGWYDNEYGYCMRLRDFLVFAA